MIREEAKIAMSKLIDVFRKEYPNGGAFAAIQATGGHSLINKIYDAHETEIEELRSTIDRFVEEAAMYSNALDRNKEAYEAKLQDKDKHITELEAKLDGLRGYCRKQIEHFNSKDSRSDYDWGLRDRTITILDKLDEGKEQ